jgi:AAA domain
MRNPPRLAAGQSLTIAENENVVEAACRVGISLDQSVLPIQGPPGAGKTFTGARMICRLVERGHKVGITAVSHKVIRKLFDEVMDAAAKLNITGIRCGHRKEGAHREAAPVREIGNNDEALHLLQSGEINVLGATSWLWCRQDSRDSVHVLFVDEAGQMSLANVLACAPAGRSLVLLGDPQQLEQPQKGSHPEGSDISALAHLLGGRRTISDEQGLFLAETRRLHPSICRFTSELFYESRLASHQGLEHQSIQVPPPFVGAGLWFVPVPHQGNQSHSEEEIERVAAIVEHLTQPGTTWTDSDGRQRALTLDQILIVAPYNDQVNRTVQRLPDAKVGTVDKFQGQQAAVVIYSMTTSTPEDAPRGMEFLYNLNRFNVATSRARCAIKPLGGFCWLKNVSLSHRVRSDNATHRAPLAQLRQLRPNRPRRNYQRKKIEREPTRLGGDLTKAKSLAGQATLLPAAVGITGAGVVGGVRPFPLQFPNGPVLEAHMGNIERPCAFVAVLGAACVIPSAKRAVERRVCARFRQFMGADIRERGQSLRVTRLGVCRVAPGIVIKLEEKPDLHGHAVASPGGMPCAKTGVAARLIGVNGVISQAARVWRDIPANRLQHGAHIVAVLNPGYGSGIDRITLEIHSGIYLAVGAGVFIARFGIIGAGEALIKRFETGYLWIRRDPGGAPEHGLDVDRRQNLAAMKSHVGVAFTVAAGVARIHAPGPHENRRRAPAVIMFVGIALPKSGNGTQQRCTN